MQSRVNKEPIRAFVSAMDPAKTYLAPRQGYMSFMPSEAPEGPSVYTVWLGGPVRALDEDWMMRSALRLAQMGSSTMEFRLAFHFFLQTVDKPAWLATFEKAVKLGWVKRRSVAKYDITTKGRGALRYLTTTGRSAPST